MSPYNNGKITDIIKYLTNNTTQKYSKKVIQLLLMVVTPMHFLRASIQDKNYGHVFVGVKPT